MVVTRMYPPAKAAAADGETNTITWPAARTPRQSMGVTQLPNEKLDWMLDDKFGMFIHWGLYSGPGRGEWVMYNEAIPADQYRQFAFPQSGDSYFAADQFDPKAWADLAKDAGMKWMCLTTRHHDGYCLFDSPFPTAFTSMQTHHRDFVNEYVQACRATGLKVGLYYSPLSWRYPGYFDVTGTNCAKNNFGFKTDPAHKENARLMKEENYVNVHTLMTKYGHIDQIFWDGGWLALHGSDADAAFFHEPGAYLDPTNAWPVDREYQDMDAATGRPLGIMGMVRKYQPDAVTNLRYGWIGDIVEQEGSSTIKGPMRTTELCDKCLTMEGSWGFNKKVIDSGRVMTCNQIIRFLADVSVRNMTLLLNVGPDRHGVIPAACQEQLRAVGGWLDKTGEAVYGTRAGPWEPLDGQYGFCRRGDTIYVHILQGFTGEIFELPAVGPLNVLAAYDVVTKKPLPFAQSADRRVQITGIDREESPVDTIVAVKFDKDVMTYAAKRPPASN